MKLGDDTVLSQKTAENWGAGDAAPAVDEAGGDDLDDLALGAVSGGRQGKPVPPHLPSETL